METQLEILEAQALKLTTSERAHLAERLIASLDEDGEIEAAWAAEVKVSVSPAASQSDFSRRTTQALPYN